jgi:hypothetical protein
MASGVKQMKQPPPEGGGCLLQIDWLVQDDALSEWATIARLDIKLDRLTLDERLATLTLNLRVVNKDVRLAIDSDETPTLLVIEPLNGSYSHCGPPCFFGKGVSLFRREPQRQPQAKGYLLWRTSTNVF